ncbi:sulfotransferase [Nocardioides ungokensis]|uniref:sulfotransferase n=1 Tax=Nocardioides ungokensis TaxID=1643322 RepID=UPI0015DFB5A7|nr:sulfotransferase [Nocardioides ungokensis]
MRPFYGMDTSRPGRPARHPPARARHGPASGPRDPGTGFKEIRWDDEDVERYVAWLCKVFPGARFVVNTRDLASVAQSKWWAETPDAAEQLAATERLLALAESLGDDAFHVHYDEYVADPRALKPFFDWLGEDFDEARVRGVLEERHSY